MDVGCFIYLGSQQQLQKSVREIDFQQLFSHLSLLIGDVTKISTHDVSLFMVPFFCSARNPLDFKAVKNDFFF